MRKKKLFANSEYSQETKASVCERAIPTLKHKIYRDPTAHNMLEYLSVLNSLVSAYNNTPHRGLKGKTPSQVHMLSDPKDWRKQFRLMYKKHAKQKNAFSSKSEVGDLVLVASSNTSQRFATGYTVKKTQKRYFVFPI